MLSYSAQYENEKNKTTGSLEQELNRCDTTYFVFSTYFLTMSYALNLVGVLTLAFFLQVIDLLTFAPRNNDAFPSIVLFQYGFSFI